MCDPQPSIWWLPSKPWRNLPFPPPPPLHIWSHFIIPWPNSEYGTCFFLSYVLTLFQFEEIDIFYAIGGMTYSDNIAKCMLLLHENPYNIFFIGSNQRDGNFVMPSSLHIRKRNMYVCFYFLYSGRYVIHFQWNIYNKQY